jgi:large repetitive protein
LNAGGTFSNTATFDTAQTAPQVSSPATTTINQLPVLTFLKSWAFAPGGDANNNGSADLGDALIYTFAATNTGNVTLTNVQINDIFSGQGTPPVPDGETLTNDVAPLLDSTDATPTDVLWSILAPGDRVTFTAPYSVTQADVDGQ